MSNSDLVIAQVGTWVTAGMEVTWTNHQPASSLVQWKRGTTRATAPAPPPMGPTLKMVCYELPFWGAYHAGVWSQNKLWNVVDRFDRVKRGSAAGIMAQLTSAWTSRRTLSAAATNVLRKGDIVFFNGVGHVALATGNMAVANEVFSVWGMDPGGLAEDTPVERTTVGALLEQIAIGAPGLAQTVTYSRPSW